MYLPNIIPSDVRTGWMQSSSSDRRLEANARTYNHHPHNNASNGNTNTGMKSRTSDFPPLSFYTPVRSTPLFLNTSSKNALSFLQNSKKSSTNNHIGNRQDTTFEGLEQLGLELGCRLQNIRDNEVWGYTWLTPLGLDKTMAQMLEDVDEDADDVEEEELDVIVEIDTNANNNNAVIVDDNSVNGPNSNQHNETHDATDMMTENYGQMRRNANNDSESYNDNVINSRASNETGANQVIYDNSAEGRLFSERDLDAEISNHDMSNDNYSGIYREDEYHEDDDEDELGDHAYIEDEDDEYEDEDDDDGFDIGNHVIMDLQDDEEDDNRRRTSRSMLQSSFHEDMERSASAAPSAFSNRAYMEGEERYFMAYEEYQNDHSILEGQAGKPYPRNVSILESAQTRGSVNSIRRNTAYIDSPDLATPTTINSNIGNQTTGETSIDNDIHVSDFDMTIE